MVRPQGKYITKKCPECSNILRPSKLEFGKWNCKKCYRVFTEDEIKNGDN